MKVFWDQAGLLVKYVSRGGYSKAGFLFLSPAERRNRQQGSHIL